MARRRRVGRSGAARLSAGHRRCRGSGPHWFVSSGASHLERADLLCTASNARLRGAGKLLFRVPLAAIDRAEERHGGMLAGFACPPVAEAQLVARGAVGPPPGVVAECERHEHRCDPLCAHELQNPITGRRVADFDRGAGHRGVAVWSVPTLVLASGFGADEPPRNTRLLNIVGAPVFGRMQAPRPSTRDTESVVGCALRQSP
mmetsp:Transcript_54579/g.168058  ORF Transcript_54579/g.168058 Transcript_54579/m.168058 type:complete len:203 (+) Transcript_54579:325-933(+)